MRFAPRFYPLPRSHCFQWPLLFGMEKEHAVVSNHRKFLESTIKLSRLNSICIFFKTWAHPAQLAIQSRVEPVSPNFLPENLVEPTKFSQGRGQRALSRLNSEKSRKIVF